MEAYKSKFIEFLLRAGALKVGGDYQLKSKRISPWFINIGDFNDGESSSILGKAYADAILNSGIGFDLVYGIPEKGIALAVATSIRLNEMGNNTSWFFTRKTAKEYGEATNLSLLNKIKALVVGRIPQDGESIIQLDDVFTAGDAKYQARETLDGLGKFQLPLLVIAVDRQEVSINGKNAIEEYEGRTGTKVISIINALDVYNFLTEKIPINTPHGEIKREDIERMSNYLRVYGTELVKKEMKPLEQRIIEQDRSIIPACDVPFEQFESLVKETADVPGIGGYKIPARAGRKGWERWVEAARKYTSKPLIYDGQKCGTDIPDTAKEIMKDLKESGMDAVIIFPQAGPETERAWIYHALDNGLMVIVGGHMTHPAYSQSEGGFISDSGILEMYRIAARASVNNFVVPGTKPEIIKAVKETVEAEGINPTFYSPGFIAQGGMLKDAAKIIGNSWHAIIGRGLYEAEDIKKAALEYASKLK
jgi:orotidine-5'-phosphate decarboxylase